MPKKISALILSICMAAFQTMPALAADTDAAADSDSIASSENESTASVTLTATPESYSCKVGDVVPISITACNDTDTSLTNIRLYFYDEEFYTQESLTAGETLEHQIKTKAWESDIEDGDITISLNADELSEPVSYTFHIDVSPADTDTDNPETGNTAAAGILVTATAAALTLRKRQ